eukprot:TRINITY_DN1976_c0_g1_i2.p1 TRINITY_DN1976_c0_g1~~TRINITY_DN1976_c0_g1_i2.p1  ORF type:complete len:605 (+),score=58.80 TRINITY_DN1976_c0_g1_i2:716-2530(+)
MGSLSPDEAGNVAIKLVAETLPECELVSLYHWGSRFFGNGKQSSDWDFLGIVTDNYHKVLSNVIESENVDIAVYSISDFQELIDNHVPWALPFLFYPENGKIVEKHQFKFIFELGRLKQAMLTNQDINIRQARGFWRDKLYKKAQKRFFHVIQMFEFCKQLSLTSRIYDLSGANQYFKVLVQDGIENQLDGNSGEINASRGTVRNDEYLKFALSFKEKILEDTKDYLNIWRFFEEKELQDELHIKEGSLTELKQSLSRSSNKLCMAVRFLQKCLQFPIDYVKDVDKDAVIKNSQKVDDNLQNRVDLLSKYFSIIYNINRIQSSTLIHFKSKSIYSPWESIITNECNGLVVEAFDKGNGSDSVEFKVLSCPPSRIQSHDYEKAPQIDSLSKFTITPFLDGCYATIYYKFDKWMVSTPNTVDGGEVVDINGDKGSSFSDLFWKLFSDLGYKQPDIKYSNYCFTFDMLVPHAKDIRRVMVHEKPMLYIFSCKDLASFEEKSVLGFASEFGWKVHDDLTSTFAPKPPKPSKKDKKIEFNYNHVIEKLKSILSTRTSLLLIISAIMIFWSVNIFLSSFMQNTMVFPNLRTTHLKSRGQYSTKSRNILIN